MFATLTSKGQLTLPKEIRDRLNLDAEAILDFQIQADNTITTRQVQPDARRIRGLPKFPHAVPLTAEQMDEAVAAALSLFEAAGSCGFADCLIVAKQARLGCDFSATFDRGMRKLPGVKVT